MSLHLVSSIIVAGFAAGGIHVFMGPDHLAAVAPLAVSQRARGWLLGLRWGLGHASGVTLVAALAWAFRELLPIEEFSSHCERLVGVMLIGIGLWGLGKASRLEVHAHVHERASLFVGILHGLAGGSHFLGVLPALAMPTREAAAMYLLSFGLGTIAAMAGFAGLLGYAGERFNGVESFKRLLWSTSGVAILVGGYWLRG